MGKTFLSLATEKIHARSFRVFIVDFQQVFAHVPSKHLLCHGHSQQ